jgi:hypothetical protein
MQTINVHAIDVTAHTGDPVSTLQPTAKTNKNVPMNSATYLALSLDSGFTDGAFVSMAAILNVKF